MLTPDDALLYSVLARGIDAFFTVRRMGVQAEHLFDDAKKVWPLIVTYAFDHQRVPTLNEIRIHYDDPRLLSDEVLQDLVDNPTKMDPELAARSLVRRNLTKQINAGIDEAADLSNKDPFAARELLLKLADETAWTYGEPDSTKNPSTIRELRASYDLAETSGGDLLGYPSPWPEVDARSLGLQKGELTVILAKRKVGKTWVKLAWCDFIYSLPAGHPWKLDANDKIMFITLEMPKRQVYRRWTAIHLNLPYAEFRGGKLTSHQKKRFTDWCDIMEKGGTGNEPELLVLDSSECPTVHDLGILIAEHKPKIVFVDGFYIFKRKGSPGQWEKTLANVEDLKRVCTKTDVPIVASTQIKGSTDGGALNATSDDAAYAKAIGDYADAVRGLFANEECIASNVRYWRGLETREFIPADVLMHFDLGRMAFDTIEEIEPGFVRDEHTPTTKTKGGKKGKKDDGGGPVTPPSASPAEIMGGDDDDIYEI